MKQVNQEIYSDVLIIGGGLAGLMSAVKAAESGVKNITIVDKGFVGKTSQTRFAAGAMIAILPKDLKKHSIDELVEDIIKGCDGLVQSYSAIKSLLMNSYDRVKDFERYGVSFFRLPLFGHVRFKSRGLNFIKYLVRPRLKGKNVFNGEALLSGLIQQARKHGVRIYNGIFITDLIKRRSGNGIAGAVGFKKDDGTFHVFRSKAVILAASNNSFRGNYVMTQATTGSSQGLAYEAGAILRNMEFLFLNTGPRDFGFEGTGPACEHGAVFRNKFGKAFMKRYYPEKADRADAPKLAIAMAREVQAERGPPIYLDFSKMSWSYPIIMRKFGGWMPLNLKKLKEKGIVNLFKRKAGRIEWVPVMQNMFGGLVTDIWCQTNLPGLFAAGDCQALLVGAFNGISLARAAWSGTQAGIRVAQYVKEIDDDSIEVDEDHVEQLKRKTFEQLERKNPSSVTPNHLLKRLQEIMFPHDVMIIKNEQRLRRALKEILELKRDLEKIRVGNFHELVKLKELNNMFTCAELFLKASIMRTESRSGHFREDYPERDDENWLKWTCIKKNEKHGEPEFFLEDMKM
ncbi:MAG: FAD-dependent oxidoreductase [Candidatus Helarchaeales archaeon]